MPKTAEKIKSDLGEEVRADKDKKRNEGMCLVYLVDCDVELDNVQNCGCLVGGTALRILWSSVQSHLLILYRLQCPSF